MPIAAPPTEDELYSHPIVDHTYSTYARGNEEVDGVFIYLDMTPKGRNENEIMDWVRRRDEYPDAKGGDGA